jgi:hexosaminidase
MRFLGLLLFLAVSFEINAQMNQPHFPDSLFSTYYHQRVSHFKTLPTTKESIIFLGDSISDGAEWSELFGNHRVLNRGISGDFTLGILNRLEEVYTRKPAKVFLLIGINDLTRNISTDSVVKNIVWIVELIKANSPNTQIYVQSVFPVNEQFGKFNGHTSRKVQILELNEQLSSIQATYHFEYVDVYSYLVDSAGRLNSQFTNDGLHLNSRGYLQWKEIVSSKVFDLPDLIPMPKKVQWANHRILLKEFNVISVSNNTVNKIAIQLQEYLASINVKTSISQKSPVGKKQIELVLNDTFSKQHLIDGYAISVKDYRIKLIAGSANGLFNALQTFKQLSIQNDIPVVEIDDWSAFSWRGFMVDVGRNFQSIQQLKQQIDVMAKYKLNIFHFHLAEDIAWRIESKKYPQLTAPTNMLRNAGKFYTINELKELVAYCKDRFITLVPEIDMPGHSAAFKRALGFDMQSDSGVIACKNILTELCRELDIPYIHIGGDEVKIANKNFLPQMVAILKLHQKKVVAWDPGGNVPEQTLLQMWNGKTKPKNNYPSIDSRHLYLNHFDPIDGVVATFNHQICDTVSGNEYKLGATLCNWPDRNVAKESDLINMNAVYPVMLTFAERCWVGNGYNKQDNYLSDMGMPGTKRFADFLSFEKRLLKHKTVYFQNLSFPYVQQSNIQWTLLGPFNNKGNTASSFEPESSQYFEANHMDNKSILIGGTIWLRHFWHPLIQSHLPNAPDSSTYYAYRKIWANEDVFKDCWIGFNNLSRSTATDTPPLGAWDNKNSKVWVNGKIVNPPLWKNAGKQGDLEIPLSDEGYEYRMPTKVLFKKGWNQILIKAPVASFNAFKWNNPIKWMFSFMPIN